MNVIPKPLRGWATHFEFEAPLSFMAATKWHQPHLLSNLAHALRQDWGAECIALTATRNASATRCASIWLAGSSSHEDQLQSQLAASVSKQCKQVVRVGVPSGLLVTYGPRYGGHTASSD
eukprot:3267987-Amphidinium_carterae.1